MVEGCMDLSVLSSRCFIFVFWVIGEKKSSLLNLRFAKGYGIVAKGKQ